MAVSRSIALLGYLLLLLLVDSAGRAARRRSQSEILHCQIREELVAGTLVGNIITDARLNLKYNGSELSKLRFSFLTQPDLDRQYFAIETATGIITTTDRLDRDKLCPQTDQCLVKFDVAVRPVKNFQIIKVTVDILDVNDNAPYFPQSRINHKISESTLPGTSFSIPAALDPDSAANGVQRYELESSTKKFELKVRETADGATDLRLVLIDELDREKKGFYQVKILAHDGGNPPKSGSVLIDITVLDANDNDPVFENSTYEVSVKENVPVGTTIYRVRARDPDTGPNGEITYQLSRHTQQNYGNLFLIDSTTGEIIVQSPLDYEKGAIYLLSVTARDSGPDSLPAQSTVVVRVQDVNDNAPQITVNTLTTSGDAQVAENTPPGTFVAHISIIDEDSDKNGKFTCDLSDSHFHLQKLYLTEYKIVTSAIFDREKLPFFDLTLECRDKGLPAQTSFAHIRVTILDDNDHTPQFSQPMYTATIIENNLIGEFIVAVTADDSDIDTNGRIKYEVDEDARGLVAIDEDTGSITANVVFDHEDLTELQFHVIAKDQGTIPRSTTAKVLVSIVDIDDEIPRFQQEAYAFGTNENQKPNTEVGQVVAEDRDSEPYNHFSYSLDPSRSPMDVFKIDPQTGRIATKKWLDREETPVYYMVVLAASDDDRSQSSTVSVSVYVADTNDNTPVFDFPTIKNNSLRISNKLAVGQVITKLRAHDADSGKNARLNYLITTGNSNNAFAIDPSTGAISVNKKLEENDGDSFLLQVIVQDQGEPLRSAQGELHIFVTKVAGYAKSRSMNLSKDNLIIVIVFVVVTAIISMIIIATIIIIKRRDAEQRHNDENSKKELQRMLPPVEDVNGAPGAKVKATNAYVTAVEMDNLKSRTLSGGGENGNAGKSTVQPSCPRPQEEVSWSFITSIHLDFFLHVSLHRYSNGENLTPF